MNTRHLTGLPSSYEEDPPGEENPPGGGSNGGSGLGERLARLEEGMKHVAKEVHIANLQTEVAKVEAKLMYWAIGIIITIILSIAGTITSLSFLISRFLGT